VLRAFFLIPVVLTCFALSPAPKVFAVSLAPAGGYTITEKSLS
jgi:hypothetical protein